MVYIIIRRFHSSLSPRSKRKECLTQGVLSACNTTCDFNPRVTARPLPSPICHHTTSNSGVLGFTIPILNPAASLESFTVKWLAVVYQTGCCLDRSHP